MAAPLHPVIGCQGAVAAPLHSVVGCQGAVAAPLHSVVGCQGAVAAPFHPVVGCQGAVTAPFHCVNGCSAPAATGAARETAGPALQPAAEGREVDIERAVAAVDEADQEAEKGVADPAAGGEGQAAAALAGGARRQVEGPGAAERSVVGEHREHQPARRDRLGDLVGDRPIAVVLAPDRMPVAVREPLHPLYQRVPGRKGREVGDGGPDDRRRLPVAGALRHRVPARQERPHDADEKDECRGGYR